MAAKQHSRKSC